MSNLATEIDLNSETYGSDKIERAAKFAHFIPQVHSPESMNGIPYYDEEFDMAQSIAHALTVQILGTMLLRVAQRAGLHFLSDNPIWYLIPEQRFPKQLYPDLALSKNVDLRRVAATDLVLALELVSTERVQKEAKDTIRMREYNSYNEVPEFVLLYPEPDDLRSIIWFRLDPKNIKYQEMKPDLDNCYHSLAVPGLMIKVLPHEKWKLGRKVSVWYQGEELREADVELQARKKSEVQLQAAEYQIEAERLEKVKERQAKEQAEAEVIRLREILRQSGITI